MLSQVGLWERMLVLVGPHAASQPPSRALLSSAQQQQLHRTCPAGLCPLQLPDNKPLLGREIYAHACSCDPPLDSTLKLHLTISKLRLYKIKVTFHSPAIY